MCQKYLSSNRESLSLWSSGVTEEYYNITCGYQHDYLENILLMIFMNCFSVRLIFINNILKNECKQTNSLACAIFFSFTNSFFYSQMF